MSLVTTTSSPPTPFRLEVPQAALDDLHERLDRTRWPDELPGGGSRYGIPVGEVKALVDHWRHAYDWRAEESRLNALPQFTSVVDGATVHFLHVRSPEAAAVPLILTHGWPGSIVEFLAVAGPLSDPRAHGGDPADAFHLVVPSLPGFGLSGPTREPGWDVRRIARAWAALMRRLGYERYGAHGGDWGSAVSRDLALVYPGHLLGVHLSYLPTPAPPDLRLDELAPEDRARLEQLQRNQAELYGHRELLATRPLTASYGLTDSPVGQLAWIAEKFREWSDPASTIPVDTVLTNVMLYWLTGTAASSSRLYRDSGRPSGETPAAAVPVGVAVLPHDIARPVRSLAERRLNVVHWSELDRGGHFAALEAPDLLVDDLRAFFRGLR